MVENYFFVDYIINILNKEVILYHHSPAESILTYYPLINIRTNINNYYILVMQIHPSLIKSFMQP